MRVLSPLLISGTLGWLVLRLFFRPAGIALRIAFYLSLGIPIGASTFTLCSFLAFLGQKPGSTGLLVAFCVPAALAGCAGWLQTAGKIPGPVLLRPGTAVRSGVLTIATVLVLVSVVAAALLLLGYFLAYPHGMWDAHAMWNARARVLFRAPEFWRDLFLPDHPHPDYPLGLPILVFTGWTSLGRETPVVPFAVAALFLFSGAAMAAVGIWIWKNAACGLVAASVILCSIGYVSWAAAQYADIPLSAFFLASLIVLTLAYREGVHLPALALTGAVSASSGWFKNEGTLLPLGITIGLVVACVFLRRAGEWLRQVGWFWVGAAPILALLRYYRSLAPTNDIVQGLSHASVQQTLLDTHRWVVIAKRYATACWQAPGTVVPMFLVFAFAWVVVGMRVEANLRLPLIAGAGAVGVVAAGHFGAYLVTPNPLDWQLNTSVDRLALQLMPSLVFLSAALVRGDFLESRSVLQAPQEEPTDVSMTGGKPPVLSLSDRAVVNPKPADTRRQEIVKGRRRKTNLRRSSG